LQLFLVVQQIAERELKLTGVQPFRLVTEKATFEQLVFMREVDDRILLLVGDGRDGPMTEVETADASAVSRYNALIAGAAQNELYGTSESILRAARGPEKR